MCSTTLSSLFVHSSLNSYISSLAGLDYQSSAVVVDGYGNPVRVLFDFYMPTAQGNRNACMT